MIVIKEIHPHYLVGKLKLIKGYTVYFRYEKKSIHLDGSIFIETEKTLIDLNAIINQIKTELKS